MGARTGPVILSMAHGSRASLALLALLAGGCSGSSAPDQGVEADSAVALDLRASVADAPAASTDAAAIADGAIIDLSIPDLRPDPVDLSLHHDLRPDAVDLSIGHDLRPPPLDAAHPDLAVIDSAMRAVDGQSPSADLAILDGGTDANPVACSHACPVCKGNEVCVGADRGLFTADYNATCLPLCAADQDCPQGTRCVSLFEGHFYGPVCTSTNAPALACPFVGRWSGCLLTPPRCQSPTLLVSPYVDYDNHSCGYERTNCPNGCDDPLGDGGGGMGHCK